jgi:60S ribosome subunit biogenesis protein NIP7
MRALVESEMQTVLKKLANYAGPSLKDIFAPLDNSSEPDHHVLRLSKSRVYYVRLSLANLATSVARDKLLSCGTCLGIFPFIPRLKKSYQKLTKHSRPFHQVWQVPPPHHGTTCHSADRAV